MSQATEVLGSVLSLPSPTPLGEPYTTDLTEIKGLAAFVRKLYSMVSSDEHPQIGWSAEGTSLIVHDPDGLAESVLGCFFKHNNFSSFIRQLNLYRFAKVTSETKIEFFHDAFRRGQPMLLRHIKRCVAKPAHSAKSASSSSSSASSSSAFRPSSSASSVPTNMVMEELRSLKRQRDQLQSDVASLIQSQSATDLQLEEVARENEALRAELAAAAEVHKSMLSTVSTIMDLVQTQGPSLGLGLAFASPLPMDVRPAKRQRTLAQAPETAKDLDDTPFVLQDEAMTSWLNCSSSPPPSPTRATLPVIPSRPLSSAPRLQQATRPPRPSLTIPDLDTPAILPSPSPIASSSSFFHTTPTSMAAMAVSPIGSISVLPPAV